MAEKGKEESVRMIEREGTRGHILFFIAFGIWLLARMLTRTWFAEPIISEVGIDTIRCACFFMLVLHEALFGRKDLYSLVAFLMMAIMAGIAISVSYMIMADGIIFIFAARDIPFRKLAKFSMIAIAFLGTLVIMFAAIGAIPNASYISETRVTRYAIGFTHPNVGPMFFIFVFMEWAYLRGERFSISDAAGILLLEGVLFYYTNCRTTLIMTVMLVITMLAFRYYSPKKGLPTPMIIIWSGIAAILAAFSIIISLIYTPDVGWMEEANHILSGRLALSHRAFEEYGVSWLGQTIVFGKPSNYDVMTGAWVERPNSLIVDNMYVRQIISCGIVFSVMALILSTISNYIILRSKDYRLMAIITIAAIGAMVESTVGLLSYNCFLFLLAVPFNKKKNISIISDY